MLALAAVAPRLSAQSSLIAPGAAVEVLADGFAFTEGPASDAQGNVYFTDQPNDRILIWHVSGKLTTFLQGAGRSNGLSFDRAGNLWACADAHNELWRITPSGKIDVVLKNFDGRRFNGPNDLWIHPDGGIYFTDPFYPRAYWKHHGSAQDVQGVYYLASPHAAPKRVVADLKQPNGIIGTPDGKIVYIADIAGQKTYRYDVQPDGSLANAQLFCAMGSDGMTLDSEGNVYLTGRGVTVFNAAGIQIAHIPIDAAWTANVTFGGQDHRTLFITASQKLFGLRMRVRGAR